MRDPLLANSFAVEIDGIWCISFQECSGLEWEAESCSFREGGNNTSKVVLPGPGSFKQLILKRGTVDRVSPFYLWLLMATSNTLPLHKPSFSLICLSDNKQEVGRWNIFGAVLGGFKLGPFDAGKSSLLLEEVIIGYQDADYQPSFS